MVSSFKRVLFNLYMEHYAKEKKIYKGIWIPFIVMVLVPAIFFVVLYFAIMNNVTTNQNYVLYICFSFSGLVGFLFGIICILSGLISDYFAAMINRIKETVEFYGFFTKRGFSYYFYEFIRCGGPLMWAFLLVIAGFAVMSAIGFVNFFQVYKSIK